MKPTDWLHEIPLQGRAAAHRRRLGVWEFRMLQTAIENIAMVTQRPLAEVASRLLAAVDATIEGEGIDDFVDLIVDVIEENEGEG